MQQSLKTYYRLVVALLMFLIPFSGQLFAQDLNEKVPVNPELTKGKFDNGLTYYILPNKKPEKKVELRLVVNAGSILEDEDQQGLAHFMEHMNFNGTKHFQKNELVSYLQSIGVEFGADLNAYTSFDETVYILPIPTDKPGNLDKGFQIIEDWAHNALLTDKDIDDERGVVLEESRLGKGADMRMLQKYLPEMLQGSRYAERLPIGKDDILKNFKYDVVRRFYRDWYRPDLMAVIVVGDITKEEAMKYLKKHFEPMKNPTNERERFVPEVKPRTEAKAMVLTDKEATGHGVEVIFPMRKTRPEVTVGDYRESIKQQLLTQVINTRLRDLSKSATPPFPYAYAYVGGWARGYEGLITYAAFGDEGPQKALMALTAELKKAKEFGFNESEVELARKDLLSSVEKLYNERNTTESNRKVGELIRNFLEGEPIPGIEGDYAYYKRFVPSITAEELSEELNTLMSNMNFFSLITAPDASKDKLPSDAELLAMTKKGFAQEVEQTKEEKVAENLLKEKPEGSKVVSTQRHDDLLAVTYKLANGVTVTVKNTEFKSDEVIMYGIRKGGRNNYGVKDINNVQYATQVVDAMGYGDFTPTQMEKTLAGKNIRASVSIGEISANISANSTVKDFETMLQLLYLKLTAPRMDKELFEAYKKKQITQLKFLSANPTFAFYDTAINKFYGNNPLAPSPVPKVEHFEGLKLDRIMQIYKDELGGAEDYHFYIVGNVEYGSILPLLQTYLGGLPKTGKTHEYKDNGLRPITGNETFKFHKGSDPKSMILGFTYGEAKFSEDFYLKVNALAQVLDIRVIEELREKLSGIYGGGYNAGVEKEPYENYSLVLQLPCGPENVDKLLAAADEVIAEIKKDGPKPEDLEKVKSQWHEQHRENMEKNSYWAGRLRHVLFWGRDKNNFLKYDEWIDKLTVKDIQDVANMVFSDKSNTYTAILYPEEGAEEKETTGSK